MLGRQQIVEVLCSIREVLDEADAGWCVFGSAALVLNGVGDSSARDIDVAMSRRGVNRLRSLLACNMIEDELTPPAASRFRSERFRLMVGGVEVDVSGDLEVCPLAAANSANPQWISAMPRDVAIGEGGIRFASFAECVRLLRLFGRPKDLARLRSLCLAGGAHEVVEEERAGGEQAH